MSTPKKTPTNEPAYEIKVWTYAFAPAKYRALFDEPKFKEGYRIFVAWERHTVPKGITEWVAPSELWFSLWHVVDRHQIDEVTTVYLLTETARSSL